MDRNDGTEMTRKPLIFNVFMTSLQQFIPTYKMILLLLLENGLNLMFRRRKMRNTVVVFHVFLYKIEVVGNRLFPLGHR